MHGHIGYPVVAVPINCHAMRHIKHIGAPAGFDGARLGIQHIDGLLLDGPILDKIVDVALIKCAALDNNM